ncbi:hypothetical protein AJ79_02317 [Helicocarpus griseus UAMH5409]|uniref:Protein kinase domain-containing protein n=1 Tax=Helicocarpus griseus UAMH5409 TaxID=1447875 RepID=A0A2B7Y2W1_9EURO|nr:hypothetical protein AJ79_02317 [Helicocarpus griseus UAMH5409]
MGKRRDTSWQTRVEEVIMETPWNAAIDIWSFGAVLISLIYGGTFNFFHLETVGRGQEEYGLKVLMQQFRCFGPFPREYEKIAKEDTVRLILYLMHKIPRSGSSKRS